MLKFNWDNPKIIIGQWFPASGGEFITRCISMSSDLIMIGSLDAVQSQIADPSDYKNKFAIFCKQKPQIEDNNWHRSFLDSRLWLSLTRNADTTREGLFFEELFEDAGLTNRRFYDKFWRPIACDVSNAGLGLVIKTHRHQEVKGAKHLLPQAKFFTVCDYEHWVTKNRFKIDKFNAFFDNADYEPDLSVDAFRFGIDAMIRREESFISQMEACFSHMNLMDFDPCREWLLKMREEYLSWHINFD